VETQNDKGRNKFTRSLEQGAKSSVQDMKKKIKAKEDTRSRSRYGNKSSQTYLIYIEILVIHPDYKISSSIPRIIKEYRIHSMMWSEGKKLVGVYLQLSVRIAQR